MNLIDKDKLISDILDDTSSIDFIYDNMKKHKLLYQYGMPEDIIYSYTKDILDGVCNAISTAEICK